MLVNSRNFGVDIKGKEQSVMVPIADMLNMNEPYNAVWGYDNDRNGFKITAFTDIKKGEEIFDHYGNKSSYSFFINYAFIFESNQVDYNPLDFTFMKMDLIDGDHFSQLKLEHIIDYGFGTEQEFRIGYDFFKNE